MCKQTPRESGHDYEQEKLDAILLLAKKEQFLSELIAWLKGKGMWEEAMKDLGVTPERQHEKR
jgi:hypothetical protein